ncbi:hypothetical protein PspLS_06465 [Pyricularia sp. CBS 133598]|nr:hypothetical protein PspLS_06465 [Pyricularia sp. CBS 133598]
MTVYQDPGHFCHARWQQWVLTPFWILQFTMLLSMAGVFLFRLIETSNKPMAKGKAQDDLILQHVWEATNVAFPLIAAGLTGAEVVRFFNKNITPSWMVLSHILKTFFASVVLALDVTVYVKRVKDPYVTPGLAIGCALVLITCVPAVYVTVVYRRLMKHEYHHPGCQGLKKPSLSGRKEGDKAPSLSLTTPLSDSGSLGKADKMGAYFTTESGDDIISKEDGGPGLQRTRTKRLSLASFKSLKRTKTTSTRKDPPSPAPYDFVHRESTDTNQWTAPVDLPLEKYTHERCTAFDEFIQRRLSSEDSDRPDGSWMGGAAGSYRPRPSNLDFFSASRRSSGYSINSSLPSPLGLPRAPLPMPTALIGSSRVTSRNSHVGVLGSVPETAEPNGEASPHQQRHFSMGRIRSMAPDAAWATEPIRRVTIAGTGARYSKYEPVRGEWPLRADSDVWVPASAFDFESQPLHHKDGSP